MFKYLTLILTTSIILSNPSHAYANNPLKENYENNYSKRIYELLRTGFEYNSKEVSIKTSWGSFKSYPKTYISKDAKSACEYHVILSGSECNRRDIDKISHLIVFESNIFSFILLHNNLNYGYITESYFNNGFGKAMLNTLRNFSSNYTNEFPNFKSDITSQPTFVTNNNPYILSGATFALDDTNPFTMSLIMMNYLTRTGSILISYTDYGGFNGDTETVAVSRAINSRISIDYDFQYENGSSFQLFNPKIDIYEFLGIH
ncbi:hypothetical protein [Brucella anthropi]